MFICLDCGCVFDEPKHWIETHGLDSPPYEEWDGCPSCGGAYAETYKCEGCNDWLCGTYAETKNGNKYCENCYEIREVGE